MTTNCFIVASDVGDVVGGAGASVYISMCCSGFNSRLGLSDQSGV